MDKDKNDNLSVQERGRLLMSLMRDPAQQPTLEAKQAQRILRSLQIHPPKHLDSGTVIINNPVTNTQASLRSTEQGWGVEFKSNDKYTRPKIPNTKVQTLGTEAAVNQLINELPASRNKSTGVDNRYTFSPVQDMKDIEKQFRTGKPSNQRNSGYKRQTKGAFNAHLNKDGEWVGHGTRKGETTWQPRAAGGRFGKHVQFDPTDVVRKLGKVAIERGAVRFIPQIGPALQTVLTVDGTVESLTGKSPIKEFMSAADKAIKNQSIPRPATLMMP